MKYEDLLEKDEWEVKRYEILARDNYTCQDCGCRGINNDIFFPISSISDLDILLPDCLFNGNVNIRLLKRYYHNPKVFYQVYSNYGGYLME